MLPTELGAHEVLGPVRHDDVEQVPGQERDRPRDGEAAVPACAAPGTRRSRGGARTPRASPGPVRRVPARGRSSQPRDAPPSGSEPGVRAGCDGAHGRNAGPPEAAEGGHRTVARWGRRRGGRSIRHDERSRPGAAAGPRSSRTLSGVCSRTIVVATCAGTRRRRQQRDHDHGEEGRAAPSRRPAGASSAPAQPAWAWSSRVSSTAAPASSPPTDHPGDRADVGQPPPPDAQHQQRAERRGGQRERQPDRPGRRPARRSAASTQRHRRPRRPRRAGTTAPRRAGGQPTAAEHVLAEHPGHRDRQPARGGEERRERAGRHQRGQQRRRRARRPSVRAAPARRCRSRPAATRSGA